MNALRCLNCPLCTEITCLSNGNPTGVDCHLCKGPVPVSLPVGKHTGKQPLYWYVLVPLAFAIGTLIGHVVR